MAAPVQQSRIALVFHNDSGLQLTNIIPEQDFPGFKDALHVYLDVVKSVLLRLCESREFGHITLTETSSALECPEVQSSIALAIGTSDVGKDGKIDGISKLRTPLDISGLLTAKGDLLGILRDKVAYDEDGVLVFTDDALGKKVASLCKRIDLHGQFQAQLIEEAEEVLVSALNSQKTEGFEPIHPEDLLTLLAAYLFEAAGASPPPPSLVSRAKGVVRHAVGLVGGLLSKAHRRGKALNNVVWHLEDVALGGVRLAAKVAAKTARPLLIGLVARRVLQTLDSSRQPEMRMTRMGREESLDYYYRTLLGEDWKQQMRSDLMEAIKEVDEGYVTDEYKAEKRRMTAAMLRRLEVEDWDKERMKHFYYGSYGMGPWYFDMEERLHNPYFVENRGWTGPIEGWVGKNKAYLKDLPAAAPGADASAVLDLVEARKGKALSRQARERIAAKEVLSPADSLLARSPLLHGGLLYKA